MALFAEGVLLGSEDGGLFATVGIEVGIQLRSDDGIFDADLEA